MALSDLLLVLFKLLDSLDLFMLGERTKALVDDQWKGVITTFLLQLSAVSVGCLALLRFWVIFLRHNVNLVLWWTMFVVPQLLTLGLLVAVGMEWRYESLQSMSLSYPAINSGVWVVEVCRYQLLISFIWPVVAVNISYPCIARLYESSLRLLQPGERIDRHACIIYLKIMGFILVYNSVMLPTFIVLLLETITHQLQSPTMESVAVVAIFGMTFLYPLVLLTLHQETFWELKMLIIKLKYKFISY
ncbi:hypothetical protein DSO57_1019418 [Entomophthora muscae]|uniref:Uncharacterized protein n=1 Tax=Entomophthora muscae TaxID=34485 RepID=A0ACC2RIJ4_9FUNG|nr:hypothetical protein DSO57_1019418 [Entomophthora muscae]